MSLYIPVSFKSDNRDETFALMRAAPFATLITTVAGQEPHITHLPLLLLDDGQLTGHMARANPHWQAFATGRTVAVFHGPHAYISPRWYANPAREVPTWNFATVHVHGTPALLDDRRSKLAVVDATSAAFEPAENAWQRQLDETRLQAMLDAIVAFQIPLTRLEAKFKMNQNKTPQDRAQVIAGLRATAQPDALATADWMQAHE
ncbi:MAG: FMN-binding negative transcriptional regulator [Pseudomonadota bacterium]